MTDREKAYHISGQATGVIAALYGVLRDISAIGVTVDDEKNGKGGFMMAFRISSAHYGWLANVKKDGSLLWTKYKAGAALFPDKDQERIHAILCDKGISHDIEYSNVGWFDTN